MTTAIERILSTPLKAMEHGGISSVCVVADGYHVATIGAINDQQEYARLFASAPGMLSTGLTMADTVIEFINAVCDEADNWDDIARRLNDEVYAFRKAILVTVDVNDVAKGGKS